MKRLLPMVVSLLLCAALGSAHGNEEHVMGLVSAVAQDTITVQTVKNHKVTVKISHETKFEKGSEAATLNDVRVGDRVVIHAGKRGDQLEAHTVQIGVDSPPAARQHNKE
jgi:hypothetical protein